jgi:hypothetical protein
MRRHDQPTNKHVRSGARMLPTTTATMRRRATSQKASVAFVSEQKTATRKGFCSGQYAGHTCGMAVWRCCVCAANRSSDALQGHVSLSQPLSPPSRRCSNTRVHPPSKSPLGWANASFSADSLLDRPWMNAKLSPDQRTELLLAVMAVEEKVAQLGYGGCGSLNDCSVSVSVRPILS